MLPETPAKTAARVARRGEWREDTVSLPNGASTSRPWPVARAHVSRVQAGDAWPPIHASS
jgi:hypothetical protein